jgi:hypothetical protein
MPTGAIIGPSSCYTSSTAALMKADFENYRSTKLTYGTWRITANEELDNFI